MSTYVVRSGTMYLSFNDQGQRWFSEGQKQASRFASRELAKQALSEHPNKVFGEIVRLRSKPRLQGETVLVLRTVAANRKAYNGFVWPEKGYVEAPDWSPAAACGKGLHGCLRGTGDASLLNWNNDALWQVVEVEKDQIVDLSGKVKFPRGVVLYTGDRVTAVNMIADRYPAECVIGAARTAGDRGTATAGNRGTATAGNRGTATAGHDGTATAGNNGTATAGNNGTATAGYAGTATAGYAGTATAGNRGTATAGDSGTATAGDSGTATAGDSGTATAGNRGTATAGYAGTATAGYAGTATAGFAGTATAGDRGTATAGYAGTATAGDSGTATAGDRGTATAGNRGTATAGNRGTATAGDHGTATAGEKGILQIRHYAKERYRIATAYVGEDGIKPGKKYRLDSDGKFILA